MRHGLSGSAILASPRAPSAVNPDRCRTLVARNSGSRFSAAQVREVVAIPTAGAACQSSAVHKGEAESVDG